MQVGTVGREAEKVETVWRGGALLGEGPVWDARRGVLWFVDIKARLVHRYDPADGGVASWPAPAQIGWVLPARDGRLLAGLQTGLAAFDPADGGFAHLAGVEPDLPANRLNDATVAPDGSVYFGSMDDGEAGATGRVYRWRGGAVEPLAIDPVCITNGPAVSPDGGTLYHVDTVGGVIHAFDLVDGAVSNRRDFAAIDPADGSPDGVVTDAAGDLWVALWGGGCVRRYSPEGVLRAEVRLPAANVTKIAFGGDDGRTAYATSASVGLDEAGRRRGPDAGGLFAFRVETPGRALPLVELPPAG